MRWSESMHLAAKLLCSVWCRRRACDETVCVHKGRCTSVSYFFKRTPASNDARIADIALAGTVPPLPPEGAGPGKV